jgi:quinol-cytochrome oxidoreductase complex cytochrome b subunit
MGALRHVLRQMSTKDALPSWLRTTFIAMADAPLTNLKSLNALLLVNATALFLFVGAWFQVKLDQAMIDSWLIFLSGLIGFAVAGAGIKRATYKPMPPSPPDIEDVAATTATPKPDVLTKADAQQAAEVLATTLPNVATTHTHDPGA